MNASNMITIDVTRSFLYFIENVEWCQNKSLISLNNLSIHNHLIQNIMRLLDIVHNIQLTYILKILIHRLH